MKCEKVLFLITSHLSKDMFTVAVLDNFNHQDRSSLTVMTKNHDTASIFFQVKPDYTPSKPLQSSVSLKTVSDLAYLVLPCQKMLPLTTFYIIQIWKRDIWNSFLKVLREMKFFLIIQSQANLQRLDVKHYFPIRVC